MSMFFALWLSPFIFLVPIWVASLISPKLREIIVTKEFPPEEAVFALCMLPVINWLFLFGILYNIGQSICSQRY